MNRKTFPKSPQVRKKPPNHYHHHHASLPEKNVPWKCKIVLYCLTKIGILFNLLCVLIAKLRLETKYKLRWTFFFQSLISRLYFNFFCLLPKTCFEVSSVWVPMAWDQNNLILKLETKCDGKCGQASAKEINVLFLLQTTVVCIHHSQYQYRPQQRWRLSRLLCCCSLDCRFLECNGITHFG